MRLTFLASMIISCGLLVACTTVPAGTQVGTGGTPATQPTLALGPNTTADLATAQQIAAAIAAAQPGTPWGLVLGGIASVLGLVIGAYGTGHSIGTTSVQNATATGPAPATPPKSS